MRPRLLPYLVLLAALALLPACAGLTNLCKAVGLCGSPRFVLPAEMPLDFKVVIAVHDATEPPIDYQVELNRSGKVHYAVLSRAPRRQQVEGDYEITEGQVVALWKSVVAAKFDELDERYPSDGAGPDKSAGVARVFVVAGGLEKTVETDFQKQAGADSIRATALSLLPREVATGSARAGEPLTPPKEFVGDTSTMRFHMPDCPLLKDVPAERRRPFRTRYEALDYQYQPCPECLPPSAK